MKKWLLWPSVVKTYGRNGFLMVSTDGKMAKMAFQTGKEMINIV
jgi:hypothetical protein